MILTAPAATQDRLIRHEKYYVAILKIEGRGAKGAQTDVGGLARRSAFSPDGQYL